MPVISVIIPVFNGEHTITETVQSVLNQTFTELEIIVIDDGSQDSTLSVVSSITDTRVKVFSYDNAGVSTSRNRGFAHATGEYISFLDADDLWTPNKLEAQYQALQLHPQAAVAYSWVDYIDQDGKFFRSANHVTANGNIYEQLLLNNLLENGSNPLIRRQAFADVGGFDPTLAFGEDWEMWLRLSARYEFVAVPSPQVLYRMSSNSVSCNVQRMETGSLRMLEKAFSQAPQSLQYLKRNAIANLYHYLTFKAFEGSPKRQNGLIAARFFWNAIANNPSMLLGWKTVLRVLAKISLVTLLPPGHSYAAIKAAKRIVRLEIAKKPKPISTQS
ncbi:glycosyltransferase [Leptolyngbya sp. DQ-M1]|uniref:glycosyltransferase n=1 Tax=Leptolyngbya sp. DQ-M1 TaxID=2933920 RepID=UPI003296B404